MQHGIDVVGVITAPDKPAGRGKQLRQSAVKQYALEHNLHLLQPTNLKNPEFLAELAALQANLHIVVAFRMLPEAVWSMPPFGTFNLHASLLPRYRGAAPINWAIINGETETGITTFLLDHKIDTGRVIFRETLPIGPNENAGLLHDRLMAAGAQLVVKTVEAIATNDFPAVAQNELDANAEQLPHAPKLNPGNCRLQWQQTCAQVHNHVRGLSPYPAAFTTYQADKPDPVKLKVFAAAPLIEEHALEPGTVVRKGNQLLVACADGYLELLELQQSGKRRMPVGDFLNGNPTLPHQFDTLPIPQ